MGYLCFTAAQSNSTITLTERNTSGWTGSYSLNGTTWNTYTPETLGSTYTNTITLANIGDKVYFKGTYVETTANKLRFVMSGAIEASGNIMSLCSGDNYETALEIPYAQMFVGLFMDCSSLLTSPELPATTLKPYCYGAYLNSADTGMFQNCTSLVAAPVLPATDLTGANNCYHDMFNGCSSLTKLPELPAMILSNNCYCSMFESCTSLTTLPDLPATELPSGCYSTMFYLCSSLKVNSASSTGYEKEFRMPSSGTGTTSGSNQFFLMFSGTSGTVTGTPSINTTYYTKNDFKNIKLKDGDIKLYPQTKVSNIIDATTNIKTINNQSIIGSGNIVTSSYTTCTLPITAAAGTVEVSVTGITENDHPILDVLITDSTTMANELKCWSYVYKATTGNGTITFYLSAATTVALTIQVKV